MEFCMNKAAMYCLRLLLALCLFYAASVFAMAEDVKESRRAEFSIQKLIELSYIVRSEYGSLIELRDSLPVGTPLTSPDGTYFILQTERGVLATNSLESTLWLFNMKEVLAYAHDQSLPR